MRNYLVSLVMAAFLGTGAWAQENKAKMSINVCPQWHADLGVKAGADVFIPFGQSRWGFAPGLYWSFRNATSEHASNKNQENYNDEVH